MLQLNIHAVTLFILCGYVRCLNVRIGHLGYENFTVATTLMRFAERALRRTGALSDNITFSYHGRSLQPCNGYQSIGKAIDLYFNESIDVFFGPTCDIGMRPVALFAVYYNVPIMGYSITAPDLADKTVYKTLTRIFPNQDNLANSLLGMMQYFGWRRAALIRLKLAQAGCDQFEAVVRSLADLHLIDLAVDMTATALNDTQYLEQVLLRIRAKARIVLICLIFKINTNAANILTTRDVLLKAREMNMTGGDYVYIVASLYGALVFYEDPWISFPPDGKHDLAREVYQSVVMIEPEGQQKENLDQLNSMLISELKGQWASIWVAITGANNYTSKIAYPYHYLHDAFYLYGLALNKSFTKDTYDLGGVTVFDNIKCVSFEGFSGHVLTNTNAERLVIYTLSKINENGSFAPFARMVANQTIACTENRTIYNLVMLQSPNWFTLDSQPPVDIPVCGFLEEYCQPNSFLWSTALYYLALLLIAGLVGIGVWWFRHWKFERELLRKAWEISLSNLTILDLKSTALSKLGSARSMGTIDGWASKSSASLTSNATDDVIPLETACASAAHGPQPFQRLGKYDEVMVSIKMFHKLKPWTFKRQDIIRLKAIKDTQHDNLAVFIGANFTDCQAFVVVWRHSLRGTLEDILFNDEIHLDIVFKASIMRDIVHGLEYLHRNKAIGCHGSLRVDKCVVDSRWLVKLTDFGLTSILCNLIENNNIMFEENIDKYLYCMAPEILRDLDVKRFNPSPQADIYSFAMVLYIIMSRTPLFSLDDTPSTEILDKIKNTRYLTPYRPEITDHSVKNDDFYDIVRACWQELPQDRPTISAVRKEIHELTKNYRKSLMDYMLFMLEKYTNDLEKIVAERSKLLSEQRNKADAILFQLLPKSVATLLKTGQTVPAETFDCVTVYFSDIVGFTTLCSISRPIDIIEMLNLLFTKIDLIISTFDAFKVETIGDAYLIVSGLPERNGTRHVFEIADMALAIRHLVKNFVVPHLPDRLLYIRTGINTGPVATGVVGLTMPRYCLFGDSVNMASRMESTGKPMMIQITQSTRDMLVSHEKYAIEYRGSMEIKGKGPCDTYWLEEADNHTPSINENTESANLEELYSL